MTDEVMRHSEKWIWLPRERYPQCQTTAFSGLIDRSPDLNYTVAEFSRQYTFSKTVRSARLRFSGDTVFQLFCNGSIVATGPASVGGDFLENQTVRDNYYAYVCQIFPDCRCLDFFARVRMKPTQICDYSKGHGGFMLFAEVTFTDGTKEILTTDETWFVRRNGAYTACRSFDGTNPAEEYVQAEVTPNIWHTQTAPIPVREERELLPEGGEILLAPYESRETVLELDKIYTGFLCVKAEVQGELAVNISCRELDETGTEERLRFAGSAEYRGLELNSAGNLLVKLQNNADRPAKVVISFIATHYPVTETAQTRTGDPELDLVLDVCAHTLRYCRQTHHLDSGRHCEPLACTGDYYIEALMTPFSFGDMRLAEFDVLRTAELLQRQDGRIFHTTYSLIWVKMLYDVYLFTGNRSLLQRCEAALLMLLKRFEGYIGENGLIESPPDYMFVDWIYIDEISMHHPPKALGQTCLNMFYFGALDAAEKVFEELAQSAMADACREKRECLRRAINCHLFDPERGMYFEGLNTPTDPALLYQYMPQNVEKRYYLKHSNILAAYLGVCDDTLAAELIHKIMSNEIPGDYQPYFAHYLLEAVFRCGLREQYTLRILEQWKGPVRECAKGLVEGFVPPEPGYPFDHSHAWGGTPLYSLPKALLGLEILAPGMKKLRLAPKLLGLRCAAAELLTPYGKLICRMEAGAQPVVECPEEITVQLD